MSSEKNRSSFGDVQIVVHDNGQNIMVNHGNVIANQAQVTETIRPEDVLSVLYESIPDSISEEEKERIRANVLDPLASLLEAPLADQQSEEAMAVIEESQRELHPYREHIIEGLKKFTTIGLKAVAAICPLVSAIFHGLQIFEAITE